jgi:hypothetical protein
MFRLSVGINGAWATFVEKFLFFVSALLYFAGGLKNLPQRSLT